MNKKLYLLIFIGLVSTTSCKKEIAINHSIIFQEQSAAITDTSKGWYGTFRSRFRDPEDIHADTIPDNDIILNGEARVPYMESLSYTTINYDLPKRFSIYADSSSFEAIIKNNSDWIDMTISGTKNTASVVYTTQSSDTFGTYKITIGSTAKTITVFPKTNFNAFKKLQLSFLNNTAYVYIGSKLLTSFKYKNSDRVETTSSIALGHNGFVECDRFRIFNSYTKTLKMIENFNIDGQSHTLFY